MATYRPPFFMLLELSVLCNVLLRHRQAILGIKSLIAHAFVQWLVAKVG